jgi:hypothetical protein
MSVRAALLKTHISCLKTPQAFLSTDRQQGNRATGQQATSNKQQATSNKQQAIIHLFQILSQLSCSKISPLFQFPHFLRQNAGRTPGFLYCGIAAKELRLRVAETSI